jgi:hypothetical protein
MRRFGQTTWITMAALLAGAALLILSPPDRFGFYPHCPIFEATGLLCPGCGATRALAALLRGNLHTAWKLNALIVSLLPFAAAFAVLRICGKPVRIPRAAWATLALVTVSFAIFRNLHLGM